VTIKFTRNLNQGFERVGSLGHSHTMMQKVQSLMSYLVLETNRGF